MKLSVAFYTIFFCLICIAVANDDATLTLSKFDEKLYSTQERRYLLYDVNRGEGFNLRRDVYMRVANTVRQLRSDGRNYILVLPPWGNLYHWHLHGEQNLRQPWNRFFDLKSLASFVPVVEFEEFRRINGDAIGDVIYLQHYAEGWDVNTGFQMKYDERDCIDARRHYLEEDGKIRGQFFSYGDTVYANHLKCLSIQGQSSTLAEAILSKFNSSISIMVDRAETILHDHFGDVFYWSARRSMRYAKKLRDIADNFRFAFAWLTRRAISENKDDYNIQLPRLPIGRGGDYLAVHWRRADFLRAHADEVPSITVAAEQIIELCAKHGLSKIYLSTDADTKEINLLQKYVGDIPLIQFNANRLENLSQGEISIIDQWVCAHARFFIGTHVSTFSYRIQEDREILGLAPETTFNRLCATFERGTSPLCEQPAKWTIVYK